jgi:hypothetical protein
MTQNCQWLGSKLDPFFEGKLEGAELRSFEEHRNSCSACQRRVTELDAELTQVEPVLRQVLRYRLVQSQRAVMWNSRARVWRLALAGSGVAAVGVLGLTLFLKAPAPQAPIATNPPTVEEPIAAPPVKVVKIETDGTIKRAKPDEAPEGGSASTPNAGDLITPDGPDFAIIDAAGYSASLETYRGKVLLFAVVSPEETEAVRNLQVLYNDFGANPDVRVLGVATQRDIALTGFPLFYNQGSRLLGVDKGQFVLADGKGKVVLRGRLTEANAGSVRMQLSHLGIR